MLSPAIRSFVARMWPRRSRAWKARPVPSSRPDASPMPQARSSVDRPVLSVSNRQIPMLRAYGGHGAAGEDQPRSGVVAMVTRSPRVRPVQGDNLPRWQAASGGAAVGAGCFASFGNKVYEHRSGELLGDRVHDHDVKPAAHAPPLPGGGRSGGSRPSHSSGSPACSRQTPPGPRCATRAR